jgi:uncharacterized protein YkwD/LysM repeat protein
MRKSLICAFSLTFIALATSLLSPSQVFAHPQAQDSTPTPSEVIEAVNALRMANGLQPLNVHPVLMEVAQWEANAIAGGAPGHTRPSGLTLGQWLLSLGYPLSGDLSLDGYRSENWVAARTAQEALQAWLGDAPHTNTMLSLDRSDIGAGVAVGDQIYIVLETALQTSSGQMQSEANDILTAVSGGAPAQGADPLISQYILPVHLSTAHPNGDVYHTVQNGQALWSISNSYHTTVDQLRAWNNMGEDTMLYTGQVLLVARSATQPPPASATPPAAHTFGTNPPIGSSSPTPTLTPTISVTPEPPGSPGVVPGKGWVALILVLAIAAGGLGTWLTSRSPLNAERKDEQA